MQMTCLQHVPFEDAAGIAEWAADRKHDLRYVKLYAAEPLPQLDDIDLLVIMGGPMSIYDERLHPWLTEEKQYIRQAVAANKHVLGVCLGAQLIAAAMGGRVYSTGKQEIGFFPLHLTETATRSPIFHELPDHFLAFHWHGDTFTLPPGTLHMAKSDAVPHQAFTSKNSRVLALQYHVEATPQSVAALIDNSTLPPTGPNVQTADEMKNFKQYPAMRQLLWTMLDTWSWA